MTLAEGIIETNIRIQPMAESDLLKKIFMWIPVSEPRQEDATH
jgi:hypothetical protein